MTVAKETQQVKSETASTTYTFVVIAVEQFDQGPSNESLRDRQVWNSQLIWIPDINIFSESFSHFVILSRFGNRWFLAFFMLQHINQWFGWMAPAAKQPENELFYCSWQGSCWRSDRFYAHFLPNWTQLRYYKWTSSKSSSKSYFGQSEWMNLLLD